MYEIVHVYSLNDHHIPYHIAKQYAMLRYIHIHIHNQIIAYQTLNKIVATMLEVTKVSWTNDLICRKKLSIHVWFIME